MKVACLQLAGMTTRSTSNMEKPQIKGPSLEQGCFEGIWESISIKSAFARERLVKRASRSRNSREFELGDSVGISVPRIDKGPLDNKYVMCTVVRKKASGSGTRTHFIYKLKSVRFGEIKQWYPATAIMPMLPQQQLDETTFVVDAVTSVTGAARQQARNPNKFSGYCNCKSGCKTGQCICCRHNVACTSQCHSGLACKNPTSAYIGEELLVLLWSHHKVA